MLTVRAYPGDGNILLAFDLDPASTLQLAGFAIECQPAGGPAYIIPNRLSFQSPVTASTTPAQRVYTPSTQAPIQRFSWLDVLRSAEPGDYTYTVTVIYFDPDADHLKAGANAMVTVSKSDFITPKLKIGFTRGYLSSQAYAEKFHNAPFAPVPPTIDFDTSPYQAQYEWLGGNVRKLMFDFLNESAADPTIQVDVFAYDFDEPDVIRQLAKLGPRLRLFLDDSAKHVRPNDLEPKAKAILAQSAGADHVITYHFQRFAHSKVMIQRKNGQAVKVLTGSANFAIRGLYVQANNVLVFNDPEVAGLYAQAFDQAWNDRQNFKNSPIAAKWFVIPAKAGIQSESLDPGLHRGDGLAPAVQVAFSPHKSADVSLNEVAQAIRDAKSSVLFAIMQLTGGGAVMDEIMKLKDRKLLAYGMTQHASGDLQIFPPGAPNGLLVPFGFLKDHVPAPFVQEWGGGSGQVIHHKFVVTDFNGPNPRLFTGSSNLSEGGEEENGDNLLGFWDPEIVKRYAVEAIRLVDHYHFRAVMKNATDAAPLTLSTGEWWRPYFDPSDLRCLSRQTLACPTA